MTTSVPAKSVEFVMAGLKLLLDSKLSLNLENEKMKEKTNGSHKENSK
jgi:hypothetical protein